MNPGRSSECKTFRTLPPTPDRVSDAGMCRFNTPSGHRYRIAGYRFLSWRDAPKNHSFPPQARLPPLNWRREPLKYRNSEGPAHHVMSDVFDVFPEDEPFVQPGGGRNQYLSRVCPVRRTSVWQSQPCTSKKVSACTLSYFYLGGNTWPGCGGRCGTVLEPTG